MKFLAVCLSLFLLFSIIDLKTHKHKNQKSIFNCKGIAFETFNTKTGKVQKSKFPKTGKISGDVCLDVNTGKIFTTDGRLADNLKNRLCNEGYASYLPKISAWKILKNNYLVICKSTNPGPMNKHNDKNFCSLIKIDLGHGKKFIKWLNSQPAKCKSKLNEAVAKKIYESARRFL
jgi:hypothetical protein